MSTQIIPSYRQRSSRFDAHAWRPLLATLLCLVLAFGFLGSRGIWDPDEGRYTNVALTMLTSGDWINPMRNEDTAHWTKPPVAYWLIASSVSAFGRSAWAARLPIALSYLACVLLTWLCARRLAKGTEGMAAVVYATMLLPVGAAQLVTTDFPLAATQALAIYAFIESRFGYPRTSGLWLWLMWIALAVGFMTKGPPALIPLLPVVGLRLLSPGRPLDWRWHLTGGAIFLALILPWYLSVVMRHEGLASYFVGAELVDRVASDRFKRNGEWYGWLKVYGPTLLLGTLPWTGGLLRWARRLPSAVRSWREPKTRVANTPALFLALWILVPLLMFCAARSRLPLYVLPLFVPIAIAVAIHRRDRGLGLPSWRWLVLWAALMMGLRLAAAAFPTHKDASGWAEAILARASEPVTEVIFVEDMARYGLNLHLGVEIEKVARTVEAQPRFGADFDEPLIREVQEAGKEHGLVYVTKQALWPAIEQEIQGYGYRARELGTPHRGRVIFEVLAPEVETPGSVSSALSEP